MLENNFISLTKETLDILLKQDKPADLIALYSFYSYTAKWQKTNVIKCTTDYVATGLKINDKKVRRLKKSLLSLGLIEDVKKRDDKGQVVGHYVKVNYVIFDKLRKEQEID